MANNYYKYPHNIPSEDTIAKFFFSNKPLVVGQSLIDFVKYDGGSGVTNIEIIYEKYNSLDKLDYKDKVDYIINGKKYLLSEMEIGNMPLYNSPSLLIPKDLTKSEFLSIGGKGLFLERKSFNFFFSDKLFNLLSDPGYVRSENVSRLEGRGVDIEIMMENIQVWIWSRALNEIIDVSPFITNLNTNKSDIGSFSFSLDPVKNINRFESSNKENIINYFNLNEFEYHNSDFFYNNLQNNDIVFIRFEKLKLEGENKNIDYSPTVDKSKLPNQVWDMIGLVDNCSMSQSYQNSSHEVSVSGRDLMKLFIEDGSYFMNLALLQGSAQKDLIVGFNKKDKWFKRNIYDGKFGGKFSPFWFPNSARTIRDTIGFIINQLSNLGVLGGEDLFFAYGDKKRTKKYQISGVNDDYVETLDVDGIWQIIKVLIDKSVDKRRISDDSLSYIDGTILEQINKTCQKPFVEFYGDTYGNEFNLIIRQPPFTEDTITSFLSGKHDESDGIILEGDYKIIELESKDIQSYSNLQYDTTYYSWFQLNPNDSFLGAYNKLAMGSIIPIIYFTKIAECFGNHRLIVNDNYLNSNVIEGSESSKDRESYRSALLNDLKYIIDSHIYLPFTRKGTIVLTKGDRRIKKGIWIRLNPTRELFYVDSVSNSISFSRDKIDRTTTLNVSRGMIEDYIYGANGYEDNGEIITSNGSTTIKTASNIGKPIKFKYFDIVNTIINYTKETVIEYEDNTENFKKESDYKYSVVIGVKNSLADQNNNPGNLEYREQQDSVKSGRWAKFETPELGFEALVRQIKLDQRKGNSVRSFILKYHPISENGVEKTELYIDKLNRLFNTNDSSLISNIDPIELSKFIAKEESSSRVNERSVDSVSEMSGEKGDPVKKSRVVFKDNFDFSVNDEIFDFFLKRKHLNIYKYGRNQ